MKRIKGKNFTDRETAIFLDVIEPYVKIIENKKTDGASVKEKNVVWDNIYKKFNSHTYYERTVGQLKTYYDNFKRRTRKNVASVRADMYSPDVGVNTKRIDENEARLIDMLKQFETLHNPFDSTNEYHGPLDYSASETSDIIESKVLEPVVLTDLSIDKGEDNVLSNDHLEEEDSSNIPASCQDEKLSRKSDNNNKPSMYNNLISFTNKEIEMSNIDLEYNRCKLELKRIELKRAQREMEEKDELFILTKKRYLNELIMQENEIKKQELDIKRKEYELKMLQ